MSPKIDTNIARVAAERVRPLRQAVLRPHQPPEACTYPGDDLPSTGHFALILDDAIVGVSSIFREAREEGTEEGEFWRIRGMATAAEARGLGHGAALLQASLDHARSNGGTQAWCNARSTAAGFYRRMGFREDGSEFELEGLGPHFVMVRDL